jgi:AcrR family transcriptional regulator
MNSDARERVLETAQQLFAAHGYKNVTLQAIAAALGMRHASLYHHVPGGKEQLFIEVTERTLRRHHQALEAALTTHAGNIRAQLQAVAEWLVNQPPMDLVRMTYSDMPAIESTEAERLSSLAYDSLIIPIEQALRAAADQGVIQHHDLGLVAGGLLGMIGSLHAVPEDTPFLNRTQMAHDLLDVMLNGLYTPAHRPQ